MRSGVSHERLCESCVACFRVERRDLHGCSYVEMFRRYSSGKLFGPGQSWRNFDIQESTLSLGLNDGETHDLFFLEGLEVEPPEPPAPLSDKELFR